MALLHNCFCMENNYTISKYFVDLDIDATNALRSDLDLEDFKNTVKNNDPVKSWTLQKEKLLDIYNKDWLDYIESIAGKIVGSLIFWRAPRYFDDKLHIDIKPDTLEVANWGLNFSVADNDNSDMIWYEPNTKELLDGGNTKFTTSKSTYRVWSLQEFDGYEAARKKIGQKIVLINTSIPHTIETFNKERWGFSLRTSDMANLTWEDATVKFQSFINN